MKIVFIGAGNVATHLATAMERCGVGKVCQVFSRTLDSAETLCKKLIDAIPVDKASDIISDADIYMVCLVDGAVNVVLDEINRCVKLSKDALWLHTSGSLPKEVLVAVSENFGVFYPLQTFSRMVDVEMSEVPIFIEGSSLDVEARVKDLAEKISRDVHFADSELRRRMHIAAVFACNFTNYMFTVADDLLRRDNLTLSVLYPLIKETMRKATAGSPAAGQTGPAVRGDFGIVEKHASMLPEELAVIYRMLSEAIYRRSH